MPLDARTRSFLVKLIEQRLIPTFEHLGFRVVPLSKLDKASSEIATSFPFGQLRRPRDGDEDILEIQLNDKNASLRINIGKAPRNGIQHAATGHVPQSDIWVHYLDDYYELIESPRLRLWFGHKWFSRSPTDSEIEQTVDRVVQLVPEVNELLQRGIVGPHIRRIH